jgi:hypothetical protein
MVKLWLENCVKDLLSRRDKEKKGKCSINVGKLPLKN